MSIAVASFIACANFVLELSLLFFVLRLCVYYEIIPGTQFFLFSWFRKEDSLRPSEWRDTFSFADRMSYDSFLYKCSFSGFEK